VVRAQQELAGRRRRRRSAGAVQDASDGVGVGDDFEDTHAAAAFSAAGDLEREPAVLVRVRDLVRMISVPGERGERVMHQPGGLLLFARDDAALPTARTAYPPAR